MKKNIQHTSYTSGKKGRAAAHSNYIAGKGRHKKKEGVSYVEDSNLPPWAEQDATIFFSAADSYERKSYFASRTNRQGETYTKLYEGRAYMEIMWAIPRQIQNPTAWARLAAHFLMRDAHPYRLAVHCIPASDSRPNIHLHLMFSERVLDGTNRNAQQFFKRAASGGCRTKEELLKQHDGSKGGAPKDRMWNARRCPANLRQVYRYLVQEELPQYEFTSSITPEIKIGPMVQNAGSRYAESRERREKLVHQQRAARFNTSNTLDDNETTLEWMLAEAELNRYCAGKSMPLFEFIGSIEGLRKANYPHVKVQATAARPTQVLPTPAPPDSFDGENRKELDVDHHLQTDAADDTNLPSSEQEDDEDDSFDFSL